MNIEYEVRIHGLTKERMRIDLQKAGAMLVSPEDLLKRENLELPLEKRTANAMSFVRVRTGNGKTTITYKSDNLQSQIDTMQEVEIEVSDYKKAIEILELLGCTPLVYAENYREVWKLGEVEVCIDTWPYLDTYAEVEAVDEALVNEAISLLNWQTQEKSFGAVGKLYMQKFNITIEQFLQNRTLTFNQVPSFLTTTDLLAKAEPQ